MTTTLTLLYQSTLHCLELEDLEKSIKEINRVSKGNSYICVESWRNEYEKANLLYWQVTCETFMTPESWKYLLKHKYERLFIHIL